MLPRTVGRIHLCSFVDRTRRRLLVLVVPRPAPCVFILGLPASQKIAGEVITLYNLASLIIRIRGGGGGGGGGVVGGSERRSCIRVGRLPHFCLKKQYFRVRAFRQRSFSSVGVTYCACMRNRMRDAHDGRRRRRFGSRILSFIVLLKYLIVLNPLYRCIIN